MEHHNHSPISLKPFKTKKKKDLMFANDLCLRILLTIGLPGSMLEVANAKHLVLQFAQVFKAFGKGSCCLKGNWNKHEQTF